MGGVLSGLISGEALDDQFRKRSINHIENVVSGKTKETLLQKVEIEKSEGWVEKRILKRSAVLMKPKARDVWIEDRLWSLFKTLGFEELNKDRRFMITEAGQTKRQIDIFAKDAESVFVVECTHREKLGNKSLKQVIDKINGYRLEVINLVGKHYGTEPKLKVKFAICTSDIDWNDEDLKRSRASKIAVITEDDMKYFEGLYKIIKDAAKYQFLGRYLHGERVEGLHFTLPATRGKAGNRTFYSFLISPHKLLRIAFINHRTNAGNDDLTTYQRMVKPSRLREIGKFLADGGKFPTNIIVNFKTEEGALRFAPREKFGDTSTGKLTMPGLFGCAWIIDGQHRLYGYKFSGRKEEHDHSVVSVLAYDGLPIDEEIQMFVDINKEQVKIKQSLVDEIISSLNMEDEDPKKRLDAIYANLALDLDKADASPLRGRIYKTGGTANATCCITPVSISAQCRDLALIGRATRKGDVDFGPLSDTSGNSKDILKKSVATLSAYFALFADRLPTHWDLGRAPGGYLATNNGLRPLLVLLSKIIAFVEAKKDVHFRNMDAKEIIREVKPYTEPLIEYFGGADPIMIASFRKRGSSLGTVDDNCFQMMAIINDKIPDFTSKDLEDYKEKRDVQGTQEAKHLIEQINTDVFADVVATLQYKYGETENQWWMLGVPQSVRNKCDQMFNQTDGKQERWRQLSLSDYPDIISKNWDLFKQTYNFTGKGGKVAAISWIGRINKAKAITDHAERGPLSRDEVDFVRRVHALVKTYVKGEEQVDGKTNYLAQAVEDEPALAAVA